MTDQTIFPYDVASLQGLARLDRLRIRHLRLLQLVAESGSLTAAANLLHISQPSTTKMLQELEYAFGATLVDRNARGGALSRAGVFALERLRIALGALDAITRASKDAPQLPLVRIGMLPLAGVTLIPALVARLSQQAEWPRLQIREGAVSSVLAMLRTGDVDCVIGRVGDVHATDMARMEVLPLSDEPFEAACGVRNPLARRRRLTLQQLAQERWAVTGRGTHARKIFDSAFVSQGLVPPAPAIESPAFHTNLATVASSDLLAFAPRTAVQTYVQYGRVRALSLAKPFQADYLVFITLREVQPLPALLMVRNTLQMIAA
ncbi:LysR family transcriptional regulator [Ottowia thiooxydans]|uniref:LysR family transcriptional regulator n=1 Tax=Ottowia thiooxydans TaxID=219182 RepID=UPI00068565C5|nr:LysR family transcriptional regulator [Ottowia thiooxydans]